MTRNADPNVPNRRAGYQVRDPIIRMMVEEEFGQQSPPRQPESEDIDLRGVAEKVRKAYIRERCIFEGVRHGRPSRYAPNPQHYKRVSHSRRRIDPWMDLATLVVSDGLDVDDYVKRQFDEHPPTCTLQPHQLLTWEARDKYRGSRDRKRAEIAMDLGFQKDVFDAWLRAIGRNFSTHQGRNRRRIPFSAREMTRGVLLMEEVEPSLAPWFRFCMAVRYDLQDVANEYREAAAWTYWRHREEYESVCCDFVPGSLKSEAGQFYSEALIRIGLDDASL